MGGRPLVSHPRRHPGRSAALTLARLPVAAQAEAGAAAAGPRLVAVGQQADVGAAARLPVLIVLAGVAPHWGRGRAGQDPSKAPSQALGRLPPKSDHTPSCCRLWACCPLQGLGGHRTGIPLPQHHPAFRLGWGLGWSADRATLPPTDRCLYLRLARELGGAMAIPSRMSARGPRGGIRRLRGG